MLSKNQIALFLAGFCVFSIIAVIITFVVWNRPEKLGYGINDVILGEVKGNVELCIFDSSSFYAKGWIFTTNSYSGVYKGNTYIALNEKGSLYKIKTVREDRPDVTTYFKADKKKFDLSGYSASSRFGAFGFEPSNEIYVITEHDGVIRGMKYACN
ncbi:hypothetical protein D3C81_65420 [compost metagenome]